MRGGGLGALLLIQLVAGENKQNETACRALGFAPSVLCSSCGKLAEFVGAEDPLIGECQQCCTADVNSVTSYPRAVLDVCR